MLGIILTGHGAFASGLEQAVIQITGKHQQFVAIDFPDGTNSEQLKQKIHNAIIQFSQKNKGVIFLTDIIGGTPFNIAAQITMTLPKAEVISGTNLPLLLEMLLCRDGLDTNSFRNMALSAAQNGITSLSHQVEKKDNKLLETINDGI